jgi:hypothetical protein
LNPLRADQAGSAWSTAAKAGKLNRFIASLHAAQMANAFSPNIGTKDAVPVTVRKSRGFLDPFAKLSFIIRVLFHGYPLNALIHTLALQGKF